VTQVNEPQISRQVDAADGSYLRPHAMMNENFEINRKRRL